MTNAAGSAWNAITNTLGTAWSSLSNATLTAWDWIKETYNNVAETVTCSSAYQWYQQTEWAQMVASAGVGFIPVVGDIKDIQEAITGVDLITGEQLTTGERWLSGGLAGLSIILAVCTAGASEVIPLNSLDEIIEGGTFVVKNADEIKASSKILRKNLINAGIEVPDFANAAHHIVAGVAEKADDARKILKKFEIGINDAVNGVFLRTTKDVLDGAYHPSLHTNDYYDIVTEMITGSVTKTLEVIIIKQ